MLYFLFAQWLSHAMTSSRSAIAAASNDDAAPEVDPRVLLLSPEDNCLIACAPIPAGTSLLLDAGEVTAPQSITRGHKVARCALRQGDKVLRCGAVIGFAARNVAPGQRLDAHNLKGSHRCNCCKAGHQRNARRRRGRAETLPGNPSSLRAF